MSMISRAIHNNTSTFQLISDQGEWLQIYDNWREKDSDPALDRMYNATAILQATFESLADNNQLRVKRFAGYVGLSNRRKYYHEIQILDQHEQVVETLIGSIPEADMPEAEIYIKSPLDSRMYDRENGHYWQHPYAAKVTIVLPITFPNRPEFRDEEGNPLDCGYELHSHSYYPIEITMEKEFITDEFIGEEVRKRCNTIKEELMINCWSPKRMEYLLDLGYEIDDM